MKSPLRRFGMVAGVAAAGVILIAGVAWRSTRPAASSQETQHAPPARISGAPVPHLPAGQRARRAEMPRRTAPDPDDPGPVPGSLEGTDVDGWLGVDDDGRLVVTPGARWFFDYFLSAVGEESVEHIRARIGAEVARRLPEVGARQALDLFDRYLAYRERVRTLQESPASEDLGARLAQLHELRRETFGDADASALFGEEEQVQAVDIERRHLLRDTTLAADERQRRLDALEQQLPETVRQARADTLAPLRLLQDEQQLREAGGSAADLRTLREERFGTEAAARLAALDRERADWQQRLDEYRSARQAIDANDSLTPEARARGLDALLAERFSPQERLRVEALAPAGNSGSQ